MNVVVVESPAKAKTINKYLGKDFHVLASYGHIRDLPAKDGSVRPDDDFAMSWEMDSKSSKRLNDIAAALKSADKLILATDPDREGEAISWHVLEALNRKGALKDKEIERVVFNAITKSAVVNAIQHPRQIDDALVEAYLARRALDYLVGFNLSPVLWRKLPGARSAGRVQSVALRLICDRELEIEAFVRQEYWTIEAVMNTGERRPVLSPPSGSRGQQARQDGHPRRSIGAGDRSSPCRCALRGIQCRGTPRQTPSGAAFHHVYIAAGSIAQAWLFLAADHAGGPEAL
jgi:DNA topoisomerase-1